MPEDPKPRKRRVFAFRAVAGALLLAVAAVAVGGAAMSPPPAESASRAIANAVAGADPYARYRYRLRIRGRVVAGFSTPPVRRSNDVKGHGRSKYEMITLERGVTVDPGFAQWAASASPNPSAGPTGGARGSVKSVLLESYDENGRLAQTFAGVNCWISHYSSLPDLNANASDVAIEELILACENIVLSVKRRPRVGYRSGRSALGLTS
jgi:phage tail-like protein